MYMPVNCSSCVVECCSGNGAVKACSRAWVCSTTHCSPNGVMQTAAHSDHACKACTVRLHSNLECK